MFTEYLPLIYSATLMTLGLALASLVVGLLLSILFVSLEMNKTACISKPTTVFLTLMRGLPEILVVLLIYFGSTELIEKITGEYIEFITAWGNSSDSERTVGKWCGVRFKSPLHFLAYHYASSMATRLARAKQPMASIAERYRLSFAYRR